MCCELLLYLSALLVLVLEPAQCSRDSPQGGSSLLPNPLPDLVSALLSSSEADDALLMQPFNLPQSASSLETLKYACVITRHGSRSPTVTFPTDPYPFTNSTFWPDGPGQLTRYGKQQLYATGQTLRMRYNGFLALNYHPNDTTVRANRYDRDFMSAACLLAGLYPPAGYQLWDPFIMWQPIPIWEDPFDVAELASKPELCPRYAEEQRIAIKEINKHSKKYRGLLSFISRHIGTDMDNITDSIDVWDVLQLQSENGYKLPQWTKAVFPDKLAPLYASSFAAEIAGTPEMIRLAAGPILKMVNHQMLKKAGGGLVPDRRMFIEAAHDTTLQAILSALGFTSPFPIETSAFIVFELHESTQGHTVQVLYYNSSAHVVPNILDVPVCTTPCSLSHFSHLVSSVAPTDWDKECNSTSSTDS